MTALDRAVADITRQLAPPMILKRLVRVLMRGDPDILRWRFQALAEKKPDCSLDEAILWVDRHLLAERHKRRVAVRLWGRFGGTNVRLIYLRDAALLLRWVRRYKPAMWPRWRDDILQRETVEQAAE